MKGPEYSTPQTASENAVFSGRKKRNMSVRGSAFSPRSPFAEIGGMVRQFRLKEELTIGEFLRVDDAKPRISTSFLGDLELGLKTPSIRSVQHLQEVLDHYKRNALHVQISDKCDEFIDRRKSVRMLSERGVRPEFSEIGKKIRRFRKNTNITMEKLIDGHEGPTQRIDKSTLYHWETGRTVPEIPHLIILQKMLDNFVPHPMVEEIRMMILRFVDTTLPGGKVAFFQLEELRRIAEEKTDFLLAQKEEEDWLRTLSVCTLPQAIKFLRISDGLSDVAFGEEIGINRNLINRYENGGKIPLLFSLNRIIEGSCLEYDGYPAQLLRLKRERKEGREREPMRVDEFMQASVGEKMEYIRIIKGLTPGEMGKQFGITDKGILRREQSKVKTPADGIQAFINWLALPEESVMRQLLLNHISNTIVVFAPGERERLLNEEFIFSEHLEALGNYDETSDTYQMTLQEVEEEIEADGHERNVVSFLEAVRKRSGYNQRQFSLAGDITPDEYSRILVGEKHPIEVTVAKLFKGAGYSIHHPVTQTGLDLRQAA